MEKVSEIRALSSTIYIEVDGGVSVKNAELCAKKGANVLVSGSAIFGAADVQSYIAEMKSSISKHLYPLSYKHNSNIQFSSARQTHSPYSLLVSPLPQTHDPFHTTCSIHLYFHSTRSPRTEDRSSCSHFHNQFHSATPSNASPTCIEPDFHCYSVKQTSPTPNSDSPREPTQYDPARFPRISYASIPALPNHCSASPPSFPRNEYEEPSSCPLPR